jgi:hypothetical protein
MSWEIAPEEVEGRVDAAVVAAGFPGELGP